MQSKMRYFITKSSFNLCINWLNNVFLLHFIIKPFPEQFYNKIISNVFYDKII